jgi:hypothetical protein
VKHSFVEGSQDVPQLPCVSHRISRRPSCRWIEWESYLDIFLLANIPEVMKTRLQLQGELMKTSDAPKVYANVFDVFKKTWKNEGIRGLQRGLVPAVSRECSSDGYV